MPTGVYIRANDVQARLRAGLAADHVDDFSGWLRHRRYTDKTIVEGLPQVLGSPRHEGILASFFDPGEARGLDFEVGENWRRG